ncbi:PAS domain-containing protein [Sphingomonadaceae bacterium]|nr:PAS domain-containing protein [Sphingomonadaceae bacterium]
MKLRVHLNAQSASMVVVALIALASVALAYAEDSRIADEAAVRYELEQAKAQLTGASQLSARSPSISKPRALWPVYILLGGFGLAAVVFIAFHNLWRSQQAAELFSTEQRLSLARSKERLRSVFENAGDGICGLNMDGKIIFANPAAAQILNVAPEMLAGDTFARLLGRQNDLGSLIPHNNKPTHTKLSLRASDGRDLTVELTATLLRNHAGEVSGTVVIFRDITERVTAEKELRDANSELEEFAYRTSHDLRSPLVSAVALMKTVGCSLEQGRTETASKSIDLTISALEGLERLVEDIHLLSRTKAEKEDSVPVDLAALARGALEQHTYLDGFAGLTIETDFQVPIELSSKPRRVELIVNNLISNAIKYRDPEQTDPVLRISAYPQGNAVVLAVEDNGLGIPEGHRESLFSMFKRFHPKVAFGSGLGLYMVRKSAEMIGAQVCFEPCYPGSRFTVSFPAEPAQKTPALGLAA